MKKAILLCLLALVFACKKKKTGPLDLSVENSAIIGIINPLGATSVVYITDANGNRLSAPVSTTGEFRFDKLSAGKYMLSIPPNVSFVTFGGMEIELQHAQTVNTGLIILDQIPSTITPVIGRLLPVGFGQSVVATDQASGQVYSVVPLASSGSFMLSLPNGNYKISFGAKSPTSPPADQMLTVSGLPVDLGSLYCKDETSGSISGKMSPVSAMATVKATNEQTGDISIGTMDRLKGTFEFPILSAGNYKISFTANAPYLAPADITATVSSKQVTNVGTVVFLYDNDARLLSAKIGGRSAIKYNPTCSFQNGVLKFSLSHVYTRSSVPEITTTVNSTLDVVMDNITATGKYIANGTLNANMILTEKTSISFRGSSPGGSLTWSVKGATAFGQVEILAIDPIKRTIRGTFTGKLKSDISSTMLDKSVDDGIFYMNY